MVKKGNEKGYTLLIVLLVVTLIMIISTSFFSLSLSNAKQERTVDTNNLAVVAAEMGVDYYKTAITNAFNIKKSELLEQAEREVNALDFERLNTEEISWELEEIRQRLIMTLEEYFDTIILSIPSPEDHPISATMGFDKLIEPSILSDLEGVIIKGTIIGFSESRKYIKSLDFDIMFEVPQIKLNYSNDRPGNIGDSGLPVSYPSTEGIPDCSGSLKNQVCKGGNTMSLSDLDNSEIYLTNGYYQANGQAQIGSKKATMNSTIYSNGSFFVPNMNNMIGVTLISYGSITVNSNIQNMENSSVKVRGSFTINGNFMNMKNSRVCVVGSFAAHGQLKNKENSNIYVFPEEYGKVTAPSGAITIVSSEEELWANCGGDSSGLAHIDFDWNDNHIVNVEYN